MTTGARTRREESGIALLQALLLLALVTALAGGVTMVARVELLVAARHAAGLEGTYAAQAMLALAARELGAAGSWSDVLAGARTASFADGPATTPRQIPGAGTVRVCCGAGSMTDRLEQETGVAWRPFAWHSLAGLVGVQDAPPYYLVAWVADDGEDGDGDAGADNNGRVLVRAEAVAPSGVRRAVEMTVAWPAGTSGGEPAALHLVTWREVR